MKKTIFSILLVLALVLSLSLVLAAPVAAATTYYVATTGSDSNGGTSWGDAWLTIQHAVDTVGSGDTINVAAGTYAGAIVAKNVTISGASGGTSVIDTGVPYKVASGLTTAFRLDAGANGTEIRNFTINNNATASFYFAVFARVVDDVTIDSLEVNDTVQGISNWGGSGWTVTNNTITDTVAAGGGGIGIFLGALNGPSGYGTCCDNLVQYNTIDASASAEDYSCPAICLCLDLRGDGHLDVDGSEDISGNQILDNTITASAANNLVGIEVGTILGDDENDPDRDDPDLIAAVMTAAAVHDNTVQDNTVDGADMGIYFYNVTNLTITQNTVQNNVGYGMYAEHGQSGTVITGNTFTDNEVQLGDETDDTATLDPLDIATILNNNTFDRAVTVDHPGASLLHTIWSSIQDGIDAASPGDTINVAPGTYHETHEHGPGGGVAVEIPWFAEGAGGLTIQSTGGAANTIIDCDMGGADGWAAWGVQIVSNGITFSGFTVKNAYSLINQVSGKNHVLSDLILTDFVNYGLGPAAAHDCAFSNITIHGNDVSESANRLVKGIDIQEYGSGGNTNNTFENITIYDIETTGDSGTSMGIYFEGDNPGTHPTTGNTFTNVEIYNLTSAYFNCGVYILDGSFDGTGHINPYAIEDTTFTGGSIHDFTESDGDVVSRGFYVKGGNKNLDVTCFDITGCDEGFYFKSFDWVQPPTFPPTGWVNNDSWVASTGGTWVSPRTGTYAAGIEICTSTPDDYLIMPQQSISSGDNVSLYAHGTHMSGDVHFKLMVSTTGTDPADFTTTLGTYLAPTAFNSWLAVSEDLSAYDGQSIYIAVHAYESTGGPSSELLVDDVTLPDGSTQGFEGAPTTVGAVDVDINFNNIYGNTNYGVDNSNGTGTIDAEYNWWGDASGPGGVGPGTGDAVSDDVLFYPWLHAQLVDCDPGYLLDHFECYNVLEGPYVGQVVSLEDQFHDEPFDAVVESPVFFANPAEKWHEDTFTEIWNFDDHLTVYSLSLLEGESQNWCVEVYNQFGAQNLTVFDPVMLAVPTQKAYHDPFVGPDHYLLYEVVDAEPFEATVLLWDQFHEIEEVVLVLEPVYFANPVIKNGEPIEMDSYAHLVFYEILAEPGAGEVWIQNQFGFAILDLFEPSLLAVPTDKVSYEVCGDRIGVYQPSTLTFELDINGNGVWDVGIDVVLGPFGLSGDKPIIGDWNGDGFDEIGVWRAGWFHLDFNGNGLLDGGDQSINFGLATDTPIIGDWDGSGFDKIGVWRAGWFHLDYNGNGVWDGADQSINFGLASDTPIIGDWDGTGFDKIGVWRAGWFHLDYNGNGVWDGADQSINFGLATDKPIIGDWNCDGFDEIGIYRPGARIFALDMDGNGLWNAAVDAVLGPFGLSGDVPIIGRW